MNIIIPLGGLGERFKNEGYHFPKPLVKVLGTNMINYLINNLKLSNDDEVHIIYNSDLEKFDFTNLFNIPINFIKLDKQTQGAAETLLIGLEKINNNKKILVLDCDTFYFKDIISIFRKSENNLLFNFIDYGNKPIYSYIKTQDNIIIDIKEKEKISDIANTGCYCFVNKNILIKFINKVLKENIRFKGEFYTSCVISEMIKSGEIFNSYILDNNDFSCVGTPLELKIFCNQNIHKIEKKIFCWDLDQTLVTKPMKHGDYSTVKPIEKNIQYLRYLKSLGNYIIIYTARRMVTSKGNIGKVVADIGSVTLQTLKNFDIPYDEIHFGKPYADFYLDDKALNIYADIEKEIGIYNTNIDERDFNTIKEDTMKIITKKSKDNKIQGEIYYYQNIPSIFKKYFPLFLNFGNDWYSMEKIEGIPLSYLFINEQLSPELFGNILDIFIEIHSYTEKSDIDIYSNYLNKIKERYNSFDYSKFINYQETYKELINFFEKYDSGIFGMIHGDPVFSNIIIDKNSSVKLIDMRGKIDNKNSIFGDINYDFAKIYQSLIGYDEILLDKIVSDNYRNKLINIFKSKINNFDDIKMITKSLLFTLIPLHNNDKCQAYYNLISKIN